MYVVGHALVKAALFLCTGIVLHRLGSVNESWLHGRGRRLRITGVAFTVAALSLADMPLFATFLGKGWIAGSGSALGMPWITGVFVPASVIVGGAVLRVAGGVFYGLADPPSEDPQMAQEASEDTSETDFAKRRTPLSMIVPALVLVLAAIAVGVTPGLGPAVEAAARFQDQAAYNATVLAAAHVAHALSVYRPKPTGVTISTMLTAAASVAGSLLLAAAALSWRRLPVLHRGSPGRGLERPAQLLRSGVVNDYITWVVWVLRASAAPWPWLSGSPPRLLRQVCPTVQGVDRLSVLARRGDPRVMFFWVTWSISSCGLAFAIHLVGRADSSGWRSARPALRRPAKRKASRQWTLFARSSVPSTGLRRGIG